MKRLAGFDCSRGTKLAERRQVLSQEERGKHCKGREREVARKVKRVEEICIHFSFPFMCISLSKIHRVEIIGMNAGEKHIYAFKSIKCHNRLEFPFITVWGSLLRVIRQRAATFISFHQTLFITPTCAPHLQSSCHNQTAPSWQRGGGRTGEMKDGEEKEKERGRDNTSRV